MQFILVGFSQGNGFRIFSFEGIAADRTRTGFTVQADLGLIGRYGIRLQDLPLLCRELLDRRDESEEKHTLTFTEEEMRLHADSRAAAREAAAAKRKPPARPHRQDTAAGGELTSGRSLTALDHS